jgi:catalase (peroxidase I)
MLVQPKFKQNDIVTIALPGGQEVLGKLIREEETHVVLSQPLTIAFSQQGVTFQAFTVTGASQGEVTITRHHIIAIMKTNDDTAQSYRAATSGLVVPEKPGLIT